MLVRSAHRLVTSVPPRSLSRAALMCPGVTDRRPSFGHAERMDPDRRLHRLVAARLRRDEPQHRPSTGHLPHAWGPVPGAGPADITRRLRPCRHGGIEGDLLSRACQGAPLREGHEARLDEVQAVVEAGDLGVSARSAEETRNG
jgi:hypothetical protein